MRFHSIAICTLTVFLTGGLIAQASENPNRGGSVQEPGIPEATVPTPTVTATGINAIGSASTQAAIAPATTQKKQEAQPKAVSLAQNKLAIAQKQVGTLAQATPQAPSVEIPQAEVAHPDNIAKELSTPDANLPALTQYQSQNASLPSPRNEETQASVTASKAEALRPNEPIAQSSSAGARPLVADAQSQAGTSCAARSGSTTYQLAQNLAQNTTTGSCPRPQSIAPLVVPEVKAEFESSPALSIYIPVGYGADRNTVFLTGSYQNSVRRDDGSVGAGGIGIGLGDARKAVGLELSYATEVDEPFGQGGFNAKLHRQFGQDLAGALGWNGFANIGRNDFEQSKYGVITKVFRTQESLDSLFSRVAFTVGVGDGQFRSNGAVDAGDNNVNVFGNVAVRVARPVSLIAEWTGQDLGLGLSIAPFRHFPLVITPAVRDLAGAGDGARFVLGAGTAFRF